MNEQKTTSTSFPTRIWALKSEQPKVKWGNTRERKSNMWMENVEPLRHAQLRKEQNGVKFSKYVEELCEQIIEGVVLRLQIRSCRLHALASPAMGHCDTCPSLDFQLNFSAHFWAARSLKQPTLSGSLFLIAFKVWNRQRERGVLKLLSFSAGAALRTTLGVRRYPDSLVGREGGYSSPFSPNRRMVSAPIRSCRLAPNPGDATMYRMTKSVAYGPSPPDDLYTPK